MVLGARKRLGVGTECRRLVGGSFDSRAPSRSCSVFRARESYVLGAWLSKGLHRAATRRYRSLSAATHMRIGSEGAALTLAIQRQPNLTLGIGANRALPYGRVLQDFPGNRTGLENKPKSKAGIAL